MCVCLNGVSSGVNCTDANKNECESCHNKYQLANKQCTKCKDADTDNIEAYEKDTCDPKDSDSCESGHKYENKKCLDECVDGYTKKDGNCIIDDATCSSFWQTLKCDPKMKQTKCDAIADCTYSDNDKKCMAIDTDKDKQCKTSVVVVGGIVGGVFLLLALAFLMKKK